MAPSEEVIEYIPFDLSSQDLQKIDPAEQWPALFSVYAGKAVELSGQTDLRTALKFAAFFYRQARELVYRPQKTDCATLIFSRYDPDLTYRPENVHEPASWTSAEIEEIASIRDDDNSLEIAIDLNRFWSDETGATKDQLKQFLKTIYSLSPRKRMVKLTGEAPLLAAILTLIWFIPQAEEIYYQELKIK